MSRAKQIADLQSKLDNNQIDIAALNPQQKESLQAAIDEGILKAPGGLELQEARQTAAATEIAQDAVEAGTMRGLKVPVLGRIFNERADYELVGDVIGSFIPYFANRKAIAQDIEKGVDGIKYKSPTGMKESFKVNAFGKSSSKAYRAVSKVVGKRFGVIGKLLPRTAARLENTLKKGFRAGQQMAPKSIGGGGGLTDPAQSILRTGVTTEAQSILLGATGAAAGSLTYDLANFKANLGADAMLDLNEITDDEYKKLPQPAQAVIDAGTAFVYSGVFGLAGNTLGYYAVKGGRGLLKRMLGVNNPEVTELAKKAKEAGTPLSISQLAEETGIGKLIKDFNRVISVAPMIQKPAKKIAQAQAKGQVTNLFQATEDFAPIQFSEFLGVEGLELMRKNYFEFDRIIDQNYRLLKSAVANRDFAVIPLNRTKALYQKTIDTYFGGDNNLFFTKILDEADDNTKKLYTNVSDPVIQAMRNFAGKSNNLQFDTIKFMDFEKFRRSANFMIRDFRLQGKNDQALLKQLKEALDLDIGDFESINFLSPAGKEFLEKNPRIMQEIGSTPIEEVQKTLKGYNDILRAANKTYFDLTNTFQTGLANKVRQLASGAGDPSFLTGAMVNRASLPITPQQQFKIIQATALRSGDAGTIQQFKKLIGMEAQDPAIRNYAEKYLQKLTSRHIFDSFYDALSEGAKLTITKGSFMQARQKIKDLNLNIYPFADEGLDKVDDIIPFGTVDAVQNLDKPTIGRYVRAEGKADILKQVPNPSYIKDPAVRKQLQDALITSANRIDMDKLDLVAGRSTGDFDFPAFAKNLGIGDQAKEDALELMMGKEAFGNMRDLLTYLQKQQDVSFMDVSTYLSRRIGIGGIQAATGGAGSLGAGLFVGGVATAGFFPTLISTLTLRRIGKIFSDPEASSKVLNVLTDAERKALANPDTLGTVIAGANQPKILGKIVDPTKPLGDYYGPRRARNLAILLNYLDDEQKDKINLDPSKITMDDVAEYMNRKKGAVDRTQFNVFQLPDNILERMYPDVLYFKYASPTQREKMMDQMKGFEKGTAEIDTEDAELEKMPNQPAQPDQNITQAVQQAVTPPAPAKVPEQVSQAGATLKKNYGFLFPGDASGAAIAQSQGDT